MLRHPRVLSLRAQHGSRWVGGPLPRPATVPLLRQSPLRHGSPLRATIRTLVVVSIGRSLGTNSSARSLLQTFQTFRFICLIRAVRVVVHLTRLRVL